ncbi:MAG: UDP-N-acetylmuramate--L-alanine ligase [Chloroflexi bacterium]|nr:UDP-N-acetylmuramate--L-alanine ligase [Chloroflexota bacterium]
MTQHVHFIGIGGTGLSAIARVLLDSGFKVSGSDQHYGSLAQAVDVAGARVFVGHRAENVLGADKVIRSSAIPDSNVEVQAALDSGIPVLKRADFLGGLMDDRQGIAVAGSHGKTSTTAMLAWVLTALKQDPTFIVGGNVTNLKTNAKAGKGPTFLIEADEYDYMFLGLRPKIAVVTNVEHDHPDIFPTLEDFQKAFYDFVRTLPADGVLLVCGDDPGAADLLPAARDDGYQALSYGLNAISYDYFARDVTINSNGGFTFDVFSKSKCMCSCELQVAGIHNVSNAMATLAVIDQLGLPVDHAANALAAFTGVGRRFQILGKAQGVTIIDDYGHHPTEIRATLAAARARFPNRTIWAVWQPHTYSRTQLLFDDFVDSFGDADHIIVTAIFRAREPANPNFTASQVVDAMKNTDAHFINDLPDAAAYLINRIKFGDVIIVFSAGDANQVSAQVFAALSGMKE